MATDIEIGARLAQARQAKNLSREQLAKRLGVSVASIQHHESGFRGIRRPAAEIYAKALRVSINWLYTGTGDMAGGPETDEATAEVVSIMPSLDERRRSQLAEYARFLKAQEKADRK
jgi:HTH-type transcriptional regulator, cell division transcriptional repressor